ncbi:MAG: VOC family protein [Planctomycetes bacterium]|nr:VOC family protein [Planctomycetota bacterium]
MSFKAIPILRIFDLERARAFYVGFLGLTVDWEHRFGPDFPVYLQVSRGDLVLHLSEHHGDGSPGVVVFVRTTGLADLHREVTSKGYASCRPSLDDAPWGGKVMEVTDPSGNRLRFAEVDA